MIAIIGMEGRFPDALSVDSLWTALKEGRDCIRHFTAEELRKSGVPAESISSEDYVPARGWFDGIEDFDADFFSYSPQEAALIDPQQRLFLECSWRLLDSAGYANRVAQERIGMFAGCGINTYLALNLLPGRNILSDVDPMPIVLGNEKDFLCSRVAYKIGLTGSVVNVQTACSTSLVAVHLACQALMTGDADMAIAGGASIFSRAAGYFYQANGITSHDGTCRPFDIDGRGFVPGNGVACVLLKRLDDAIAANDTIHAVIRGSAIGNDGAGKVGFTAPSVDGQARTVAEALEVSDTPAGTIGFVEAHGTATAMGDPIEVRALNSAFTDGSVREGPCFLGSVKSNIGHLDAAAGVAGLIKAALAVKHGVIPPTAHFKVANPALDLESTPFQINSTLTPWPDGFAVRRAAVNSLGLGGTNAHVVLEQPPQKMRGIDSRASQPIVFSAKTERSLDAFTVELTRHLASSDDRLADTAYALAARRRTFPARRALVARSAREAVEILGSRDVSRIWTQTCQGINGPIVFMFPGGGAQFAGMAKGLYATARTFRSAFDECARSLDDCSSMQLRQFMTPEASGQDAAALLRRPTVGLPALFAVEYALARLWMSWGVQPDAAIGHSMGEYTAACIAGVMKPADAIRLVHKRGKLFEMHSNGAMLSVALPELQLRQFMPAELDIAAINGRALCVASGPQDAIEILERYLAGAGIGAQRVHIDVAAHSRQVDGLLADFHDFVSTIELSKPCLPVFSNVTGLQLLEDEACSPEYWTRHLRGTVNFLAGLQELQSLAPATYVEVGPGSTLSELVRAELFAADVAPNSTSLLATLPRDIGGDDRFAMLESATRLWCMGVDLCWDAIFEDEAVDPVSVPAYEFDRKHFWIDDSREPVAKTSTTGNIVDWAYVPAWTRSPLPIDIPTAPSQFLIFLCDQIPGVEIVEGVLGSGRSGLMVVPGERFEEISEHAVSMDVSCAEQYDALVEFALRRSGGAQLAFAHLLSLEIRADDVVPQALKRGFCSVLQLVQALGRCADVDDWALLVGCADAFPVMGDETINPFNASTASLCRTTNHEMASARCRAVDFPEDACGRPLEIVRILLDEFADLYRNSNSEQVEISYRRSLRWTRNWIPRKLPDAAPRDLLKENGVYVITGGLGAIGMALAESMALAFPVRLALISRTAGLPQHQLDSANVGELDDAARATFIRRLEDLGAEVLTIAADVVDADELRSALAQVQHRFGGIDGVVHAAGTVAGGLLVVKTLDEAMRVLAPKVYGTMNLLNALQTAEPDFIVFCSALDAILATPGMGDHCAANSYMDALAESLRHSNQHSTVFSIGWPAWRDVGQAAQVRVPDVLTALRRESLELGLSRAEGVDVFYRCLGLGLPSVAISKSDLPRRIRAMDTLVESFQSGAPSVLASTTETVSLHRRNVPFVAPSSELETLLCSIMSEVLGISEVGVNDNFFELGGHSLLGLSLVGRIRKRLDVRLPLPLLIKASTAALLAIEVEDAIIRQIENLSETEAEALLEAVQ